MHVICSRLLSSTASAYPGNFKPFFGYPEPNIGQPACAMNVEDSLPTFRSGRKRIDHSSYALVCEFPRVRREELNDGQECDCLRHDLGASRASEPGEERMGNQLRHHRMPGQPCCRLDSFEVQS